MHLASYKYYLILIMCFLTIPKTHAQPSNNCLIPTINLDTLSTNEIVSTDSESVSSQQESWRDMKNYFRLDFFTTLNAGYYLNERDLQSDVNNLYAYYNLNITNQFTTKYLSVNFYLLNELGYRKYFDSIGVKSEDQYAYKFDINTPIFKVLNANISYQVKSQIWKSWSHEPDSLDQVQRILYTSYFSPGYILYTAGVSYSFWNTSRLEFGLVGGQTTVLKNEKLYDTRNEEILYGVEKGKRKDVNYGMSLQLQVPVKRIGKYFYWENSSRLFVQRKEMKQLTNYTIDCNNGIYFLFLKYLRIGIRTKVNYDKNISEKPYVSNMLLFGFYLSNKL